MIKRLYVHNYRCFENFELLTSQSQSSLLIGKNGAGKSSVGFVLEWLQRIARGTNRLDDKGLKDLVGKQDFTHNRSDVPMRFELEAIIGKTNYGYALAVELAEGFRELRVLEEKFTVGGKVIFSRN